MLERKGRDVMKRFCAFVGVVCLMLSAVALRLYFCRLNVLVDGVYTAFNADDTVASVSIAKGYERVDVVGGEQEAYSVLSKLRARVIRTESFSETVIIYAYSPCLLKSVRLFDDSVNIMIAITPSALVVGSPLIKGSY